MRCFLCLTAFVLSAHTATAHVVPNMTIEADFNQGGGYTLRMNLDPRVFLSDQPTSLPPVSADWYLNQTDEEKRVTYEKATEYLRANVGLTFNDEKVPLPACEFVALDGATYEEVKPDTTETHLLATGKSEVPEGADSFKIAFGRMANVSLILINGEEGNEERKPQVIFPGETSLPFKITRAAPAEKEALQATEVKGTQGNAGGYKVMSIFATSVVLIFITAGLVMRRRRR
ncbi:hypothetical protein EI77_02029 [Prosthecobacter fusiformis]|uniref:Uncharacterized protein n=1 Tax=Prosthecobacter fusiformis TaxID=48464 RepID=A0A4R7RYI7_9BACT|nr:hypothetical protein [Prosthecobacter fusiformis]TDU70911.1 hypothetical protein EI77_02029 [Prosthecobacter fusiformis]